MTAPWAARNDHSSVVDARTRAIYVIGGTNGGGFTTGFNDVWASTDGGAQAGLGGMVGGYTGWVL
jgi:hypothetical protein